jgi:hypothetical protein
VDPGGHPGAAPAARPGLIPTPRVAFGSRPWPATSTWSQTGHSISSTSAPEAGTAHNPGPRSQENTGRSYRPCYALAMTFSSSWTMRSGTAASMQGVGLLVGGELVDLLLELLPCRWCRCWPGHSRRTGAPCRPPASGGLPRWPHWRLLAAGCGRGGRRPSATPSLCSTGAACAPRRRRGRRPRPLAWRWPAGSRSGSPTWPARRRRHPSIQRQDHQDQQGNGSPHRSTPPGRRAGGYASRIRWISWMTSSGLSRSMSWEDWTSTSRPLATVLVNWACLAAMNARMRFTGQFGGSSTGRAAR